MRSSLSVLLLVALMAPGLAEPRYGLGRAPSEAELHAWDIDARGDGVGLPAGQGSVAQGKALFAERCAACHGERGQGGLALALAGGIGTLASPKPIRTVGSYWPYAPTVFDYIHRAMPYTAPQSLSADETYAVTAYVLHLNGLVAADAVMDRDTLPEIAMPNRHGFTGDPRPDVGPAARTR